MLEIFGFLGWLPTMESHFIVKIISDASNTGWSGILALPGAPKETRDYWSPDDLEVSGGIAVKEAKALYQTLSIFRNELANGRVDANVDNSNLIDFWNNEGGRNIKFDQWDQGSFSSFDGFEYSTKYALCAI